jgi:hypothetical protein
VRGTHQHAEIGRLDFVRTHRQGIDAPLQTIRRVVDRPCYVWHHAQEAGWAQGLHARHVAGVQSREPAAEQALKGQLQAVEGKLAAAEWNVTRLRAGRDAAEEQLGDVKRELAEQVAASQEQREEQQQEVASLWQDAEARVASMEARHKAALQEAHRVGCQAGVQAAIQQAAHQLVSWEVQVRAAKAALEGAKGEVARLGAAAAGAAEKQKLLKESLQREAGRRRRLEEQLQAAQQQRQYAEQKLARQSAGHRAELEAVEGHLAEAERDVRRLRKMRDDAEAALDEQQALASQAAARKEPREEQQQEAARLQQDAEAAAASLEARHKAALQEAEERLQAAQGEVHRLQQSLCTAKAELDAAAAEAASTEKVLEAERQEAGRARQLEAELERALSKQRAAVRELKQRAECQQATEASPEEVSGRLEGAAADVKRLRSGRDAVVKQLDGVERALAAQQQEAAAFQLLVESVAHQLLEPEQQLEASEAGHRVTQVRLQAAQHKLQEATAASLTERERHRAAADAQEQQLQAAVKVEGCMRGRLDATERKSEELRGQLAALEAERKELLAKVEAGQRQEAPLQLHGASTQSGAAGRAEAGRLQGDDVAAAGGCAEGRQRPEVDEERRWKAPRWTAVGDDLVETQELQVW